MQLLYTAAIRLYVAAIWIASFFNKKAKQWISGRANTWQRLSDTIDPQYPTIWIHCASLGEFEQGRPIIEQLQAESKYKILLTFFSPSGYEIRKNYPHADYIFYLPADTPQNARRFIDIVQPKFVLFVKYEFWYHYLTYCFKQQIPTVLVSAIFRKKQLFFQAYGQLFKQLLHGYTHIFVQNEASKNLLLQHDITAVSVAGDTRVDRVLQIAKEAKDLPIIAAFAERHHILVCGSTWGEDEAVLAPFCLEKLPPNWRCIIAPHEIGEAHIQQIEARFPSKTIRYSEARLDRNFDKKILIINNIGMLSSLYRYGTIAYIGGGFGAGIHNTLEPIAFGLPVLFGPKYTKFMEAVQLVEQGGAFCINNTEELIHIFEQLADEANYQQAAQTAKNYILNNQGASEMIVAYVEGNRKYKLD